MDKKPYNNILKSGISSKLLLGSALIVALSIPYILVKHFSHQIKPDSTTLITLEKPEDMNPDVLEYSPELSLISQPISPLEQIDNTADTIKTVLESKAIKTKKPSMDNQWQTIRPRSGDSLAAIFHRLGLSPQNLHLVLHKNPYAKALTSIKPSQELKFLINKKKLEQLIIPLNYIQTLTVYRQGVVYKTKIDSKKVVNQERYISGIVKGSLQASAQRLGIPSKLVQQMTTILSKQVDFAHAVRPGDRFSIAYEAQYIQGKMVGFGDIIAVTYVNHGKTAQAIRHISSNGTRDYYSPQGESFKKAFSRYPIRFSHISSTFTASRYHPILHYKRAHKGIDLAAPIGTPILATGDGVIKSIGRHNGYGNMIEIKHDNTYSTVYGHMLKFQKGISRGSRVRRGQVIGYVGQTGLATGPHCHYELHVHNQARNPTTTYIPTASSVPRRELASFKSKSRQIFARLSQLEKTRYASKDKKKAVG